MSTSLEGALRDMLRERAGDIAEFPSRLVQPDRLEELPLGDPDSRTSDQHTRWLLAAAVALIVAVAGAIIGIRQIGQHTPPAAPHPTSLTGAPTAPTTAPAYPGGLHPAACSVALPSRWARALFVDGAVQAPGSAASAGLPILAMTPSGDVVSSTDTVPQQLVVVRPDHSIVPLYTAPATVPGQGQVRIGDAVANARWVVFSLILGGGQGARGGIYAVSLAGHVVETVRSTALGTLPIVSEPDLLDGKVYWSEAVSTGPMSVYAYDLATGARSTLDTGQVSPPVSVGGGLIWWHGSRLVEHIRPTLPQGYTIQPSSTDVLLSDSGTYAWAAQQGGQEVLQMSTAAHPDPVTVFTASNRDAVLVPLALTGPYLIWSAPEDITVLDTRTGATTALLQTGGMQQGFETAAAAHQVLALNNVGSKGGAQLMLATVSALPSLHC
jgi:hypothetical protein